MLESLREASNLLMRAFGVLNVYQLSSTVKDHDLHGLATNAFDNEAFRKVFAAKLGPTIPSTLPWIRSSGSKGLSTCRTSLG